jgi:hypothetical protein
VRGRKPHLRRLKRRSYRRNTTLFTRATETLTMAPRHDGPGLRLRRLLRGASTQSAFAIPSFRIRIRTLPPPVRTLCPLCPLW